MLFFFIYSDTLFANYYRVSSEDSQSDNAGVAFIQTAKKLDEEWLLENAHLNVQEVSFHTIEASNAPYFTFNGGIRHRGLNFAEYSSHLVSAIRAVLLIMTDRRFHPPARTVASEPLREDQQDLFISVNQLDQLPRLLNSIGGLADRLQGRGIITVWHFMKLIFHDEGRVAVRIRVSARDHEAVLQEFREHFSSIAIRYLRAGSASSIQHSPPISTIQRRNRFDISQVDDESVGLIRGLLAANNLLSFETQGITDRSTHQSFIVRFNVEEDDLRRIANPVWLEHVRSFVNHLHSNPCTENRHYFSAYLARVARSNRSGDGIFTELSFRIIVYGEYGDQNPIDLSAFLDGYGISAIRSWNILEISGLNPARQTVTFVNFFTGIAQRVLRLFSRRNHAENGNPAEATRLLTNPNRDVSHAHIIQLPGSSQAN
ncbi:hypothetical protein NX722_20975 [Endozoicomonas gorgoniicola]|uniref:Uncharacterized protein n=1 Tax=Endozoicomonas gorgoniicola TaxID=1234144 RepID=A0ABT3N097_9GAMM|nr:hypothetical protein [Endozoicomonas gorgoniicola]MCW7555050.1 hypothetical protein [Endozoicomonas gorgoniicola]